MRGEQLPAVARCFARDGHPIVAVAEDAAELARAAETLRREGSPRVETVAVDLATSDAPRRVHAEVGRLGIVYLVNNAGVGVEGDFLREADLDAERRSRRRCAPR